MTVRQIYTRVEGPLNDLNDQFTAVLYAMITHTNLDMEKTVLTKKWWVDDTHACVFRH